MVVRHSRHMFFNVTSLSAKKNKVDKVFNGQSVNHNIHVLYHSYHLQVWSCLA